MNGAFFDSNVLIYLISEDLDKASIAEALLLEGGDVSVQVLSELTSVCRRKFRMEWEDIDDVRRLIRRHCKLHALTPSIHNKAFDLASHSGYTIYDAQILAAAAHVGCGVVWSEDMQDGHRVSVSGKTLEIRNPFARAHEHGV